MNTLLKSLQSFYQKLDSPLRKNPSLISFKTLRQSLGWMGILLPFALILGAFLFGDCQRIQPTISHYYFTNMREVFVGVLCCVGVFLIAYKGYSRLDNITSNIAGIAALGIAIFPTNFMCNIACQKNVGAIFTIDNHAIIHFTAATIFFVMVAFISIVLFTKTGGNPSPKKVIRNRIFRFCGWGILVCITVIALYDFVLQGDSTNIFVLVMESLMLLLFGISWLVKGERFWKD